MKKQVEDDTELRSEPMNEMLSHPPKWIIRSGSGLFFIIIISAISLAWFIQYPDEISGDVIVTTSKAPIELSNQSYIQLKSLDVKENEIVNTGKLIAQFDLQADPEDIERINDYLTILNNLHGDFNQIPQYYGKVKLGTFQESWTKLNSMILKWNNEIRLDISDKRIASIKREISLREQLQAINEKKINISEEESETIRKELESSVRLAEQNAISKQTLTNDKRIHSQALQSVQNQKEQKIQNLISLNTLRNELIQLEHDNVMNWQEKKTEILIGISSLQTVLNSWEKNSVWVAPCSGKVLFNKILQVNRFYKANEASVVIVPSGSGYNAIATITANGAGNVKKGQKAFIELVDYPKSEFGSLEGKVENITQIDKEGKYEVKIQLANQLKTTNKKTIPFKAQLKGTAKIITKNKRLLTRFVEQLTDLMK